MVIALGTVEFARAWYMKNSMKNASRHGARLAVVTPNITCYPETDCDGGTCPSTKPTTEEEIKDCVCASPGIKNDDRTSVQIEDEGDCNGAYRFYEKFVKEYALGILPPATR